MNASACSSTNFRYIYVKKRMRTGAKAYMRASCGNYMPEHPIRFVLLLPSIFSPVLFASKLFHLYCNEKGTNRAKI